MAIEASLSTAYSAWLVCRGKFPAIIESKWSLKKRAFSSTV
jgi:hypothetical protein